VSTTAEMFDAAKNRATVRVRRNNDIRTARLIYWPGDTPRRGTVRWKAKVQFQSGKIISVLPGQIELIEDPPIAS
jgi:hypothetical protein